MTAPGPSPSPGTSSPGRPSSSVGAIAQLLLRFLLLLAPFLLALGLAVAVLRCPEPLGNSYALHRSGRVASAGEEDVVRARMAMLVVLEVFALTLIVRPWEFPWRARRWLAALVIFVPWSGLMMAMAMHTGRLMALHGLILPGVVTFVIGPVTLVLGVRSLVGVARSRSRPRHGDVASPDPPGPPTAADAPPVKG